MAPLVSGIGLLALFSLISLLLGKEDRRRHGPDPLDSIPFTMWYGRR
jgi:hypothetical protein